MVQIEKTPYYINRPGKPRNCTASSKVTSVSLRRAATIHGWPLGQPRTTLLLLHTRMARRPCQGWHLHRAAALFELMDTLLFTVRPALSWASPTLTLPDGSLLDRKVLLWNIDARIQS